MTGREWSTIEGVDRQLAYWRGVLRHPAYRNRRWEIWQSIDILLDQRLILAAHKREHAA